MRLSVSDVVPAPAVRPNVAGGVGHAARHLRSPSRRGRLYVSLAFLLVGCFGTSSAQPDPVRNFCRRFGHQTAVIDRKLYIDGGFVNYNPLSQYPANYSNTGLHYHDLDAPGAGRMPQLYANLTKNSSVPAVDGGTLWADNVNKRFYLFGGEYYRQPPALEFTLWSFDTVNNNWESFGSPSRDSIGATAYGAGVSVSETGVAYYYGGWMSNNTLPGWAGPPVATSSLVQYSMDSNSWSTNPGPDSVGRAEGAMVFIPVGDGGMLVYFGGVQDPASNGTWSGQPMETIFLYDVLSSKWYTQNATGTVPPMRRRFCAGATWAPDQSSYNIYLYGGAGMPPDTAGFDDVYVLTIPSFQWIKMYPTDGNATGAYPHHSLSCDVIGGAQMVIIGGTFPTSDRCDVPEQHGVHNLDLGQQNPDGALWALFAANLTSYAVPSAIVAAVGGSAGGGATKTSPAAGFGDPDLRVLMTRRASIPSRTPTRAIPGPTSSPGGEDGGDGPLSDGAIAGIAVAGALGLIALALAAMFLLRRRHRYRQQLQQQQQQQQLPQHLYNHHHHNHSHNHVVHASPKYQLPAPSSRQQPQDWSPHVASSETHMLGTTYASNACGCLPRPLSSSASASASASASISPPIVRPPAELPVGEPLPTPQEVGGFSSKPWLGQAGVVGAGAGTEAGSARGRVHGQGQATHGYYDHGHNSSYGDVQAYHHGHARAHSRGHSRSPSSDHAPAHGQGVVHPPANSHAVSGLHPLGMNPAPCGIPSPGANPPVNPSSDPVSNASASPGQTVFASAGDTGHSTTPPGTGHSAAAIPIPAAAAGGIVAIGISGGTEGGGGGGGSGRPPPTKIDSEGRLWVQVVSASGGGAGRGSPRGGAVLGSRPPAAAAPHELSCEPELSNGSGGGGGNNDHVGGGGNGGGGGGGYGAGDGPLGDVAHGRPRHLTFYHP